MMRFQGFFEPKSGIDADNSSSESDERITYVGCVHGGDDRLINQLNELHNHPPSHLIFTGDITGSYELDELKRRFYDLVTNPAKAVIARNPNITDQELTDQPSNSPSEVATISHGYKNLMEYMYLLEDSAQAMAHKRASTLSEREVATGIRELSKYPYYGDWITTLSMDIRNRLLKSLRPNATNLLEIINSLRASGIKVTILSGNWDGKHSGVILIAKDDVPLFDTRRFFEEHGVPFVNSYKALDTQKTVHILAPYDSLSSNEETETNLERMRHKANEARDQEKAVIMVGHAEANLRIHSLPNGIPSQISREREISIRNFGRLMAACEPEQAVYSHQHGAIVDETRRAVGLNVKYILEKHDENVRLVDGQDKIDKLSTGIVVTHIPLRHTATGYFKIRSGQNVLNGSQKPITVSGN